MNEMCRASSTTTTIFCPSKNKRSKSIRVDFFPLKFVFYNDENGSHDTYRFVYATMILLCAIFFPYLLWALLLMLVYFFLFVSHFLFFFKWDSSILHVVDADSTVLTAYSVTTTTSNTSAVAAALTSSL